MKVKVYIIDLEIPATIKRWGLRVGVPLFVLSVAAVALAAPVTFTAGETLQAADLNNNFAYLVPSGAVIAFNLNTCPAGWSAVTAAQGRTIIGVNPAAGNGLSQRNLGDTAGEENHTMVPSELAPHAHDIYLNSAGSNTNQGFWSFNWNNSGDAIFGGQAATPPLLGAGFQNFMTVQSTGKGDPFNNMQPSLTLLYCSKN